MAMKNLKKHFFLPAFILISAGLLAQVNDIKSKSEKNKSSKNSGNKDDSKYSPKSDDGCTDGCTNWCFDVFWSEVAIGLANLQENQLKKKSDIPRIISLDASMDFGINDRLSYIARPRVRGNWGIFSTDVRYNFLYDSPTFYKTFDCQVLLFNLVLIKEFNLRIGTGFMYEEFSQTFFNEHSLKADIYMMGNKINPSFEFRIAKDYKTGATPRTEGSIKVNYKLFDVSNFSTIVNGGFIYQNYYNSIDLYIGQIGIGFNMH